MKVFGISLMRDEEDVVRANVLHSLSLGLDGLFIIDNGSGDGTTAELRRLGSDKRVRWTRNDSPFYAQEMLTSLAHEAFNAGADWIMSIDADEFWVPRRGNLKMVLASTEASRLRVKLFNFVQHRQQMEPSPFALLRMTRRPQQPIGPVHATEALVTANEIAYVEAEYSSKVISRTALGMVVEKGSHFIHGVPGSELVTEEIFCLHAPLRSRSALDRKAEHGRRVEEAGFEGSESWHVRRWRRLRDEDKLDAEWAANSYLNDEITVYGKRRALIFDPTLRDTVARWVQPSPLRRIWRALAPSTLVSAVNDKGSGQNA
jgi:hypothetical protein